ncbi:hypothetical protein [Fictibacillus sp. UD]
MAGEIPRAQSGRKLTARPPESEAPVAEINTYKSNFADSNKGF